MLLDTRIASASVSDGNGCSSVNGDGRPGIRYVPPSPETRSPGRMRSNVISAAAAKILASDPGSNVSVNALGRIVPSARREATARISPLAGSSMTTSPPSASMLSIASSRARCAISCSSTSSVSTTSLPATGSAMTRAGDSYSRPSRSFRTTAEPGVPESRLSSRRSSPPPPLPPPRPSSPTLPIMARANSFDG